MQQIVIVGSGVVGTATGQGFSKAGFSVKFIDISPDRLEALKEQGFDASDKIELDVPSVIFLTLPTPSVHRGYDLSAFVAGTKAVGAALKESSEHHTVVVRSTVPPGTSDNLVLPTLQEASGLEVGTGFSLASAPEFLRAVSALEDFLNPWMTVIASRDPETVKQLVTLFRPFGGELRTFSDPVAAEMIKCTHNVFNAAKISFWNEVWTVCSELGIDADSVATTVARSAEGSINTLYGIRGGAPYGGACLPKDVQGFLGLGDALGIQLPVVEGVNTMNDLIAEVVTADVDRVGDQINQVA